MWYVSRLAKNAIFLFPILLVISCGSSSNSPSSELTDAYSEIGLEDSYYQVKYGLSWKRLDGSPITDANSENQVLECLTGKNSSTICEGVCISNTMKYKNQERWDLMRTFYEGDGQCFLTLLAYDRTRQIPRLEQYNGTYYTKTVNGSLKGRCSVDMADPYFSGGYTAGARTSRFKSRDTLTWLNLDGTAAATWEVRMYQESIYTLYDPELNDEITYHLHDTLWCVKKSEISQSAINDMNF